MNKKRLQAEGNLPTQVQAPMSAVQEAWDIMLANRNGVQGSQGMQENTQASQAETEMQGSQDDPFEELN